MPRARPALPFVSGVRAQTALPEVFLLPQSPGQRGVVQQTPDCPGQADGVVRRNQQPVDAVLNQQRPAGLVLWSLDRGSHPRSEHELKMKLKDRFEVIHWETFVIYHEYVLGIGIRP